MTGRVAVSLLLATALTATLTTAQPLKSPPPLVATWERGETLVYNLTWLRVIGGTATFSIAPSASDPTRYRITTVAESTAMFFYKLRDEVTSEVSRETFSTLLYRKHTNERGKIKDEETRVDPERHLAVRKHREIAVTSPIFDPLSLIYHLRTLDLTPGRIHHFDIVSDGKVYVLETAVGERETITTEAGTFRCVRVEPKVRGAGIFRDDADNRLQIWYSDDERHLPVRIRTDVKVGTITASLRSIAGAPAAVAPAAKESPR